jgi:hypothetical protein
MNGQNTPENEPNGLWSGIASALAQEPAYLLIFGICGLFFLTAVGAAVAAVIRNGDRLLVGLALGAFAFALVAALIAIWLVRRRPAGPEESPREETSGFEQLHRLPSPGPELAEALQDAAANMARSLEIGSTVLTERVLGAVHDFRAISAESKDGQLSVRGATYNQLLIRLYETAQRSVFATSVPEYHTIWDGPLGGQLLKAHQRSNASVTRVFVFNKRDELTQDLIDTMHRQHELHIEVLAYFDDEDELFEFSPDIARDFTVIDDGAAIGVTALIDREVPEAKWFLRDKDRTDRFVSYRESLRRGSHHLDAVEKWWKEHSKSKEGAAKSSAPYSGNPLMARFWTRVEGLANQAGLGITPDCESDLRALIAEGVGRIEREGSLGDEKRIEEAEANLATFVQRMVLEAKQRNLRELQEVTFRAARESLCPIWPFC